MTITPSYAAFDAAYDAINTGGAASGLRLQVENVPVVRTESKNLQTTGVASPVWIGVYPVFGQPVIELPADGDTTLCGLNRP